MTNEALAWVKINALLTAHGWNTQDSNAVEFEIMLPDGTRAVPLAACPSVYGGCKNLATLSRRV
jgi:hypothetical protein